MTTPKIFLSTATATLLLAAGWSSTGAQSFVTKKPNAADWAALANLPDFNGVWERGGAAPRGNAGQAGNRGAEAAPAGTARGGAARGGRGGAAGAQRGGGGRGGGMQLTPEYEARRRAYQASAPEDDETANCLPPGMPGIMTQPYPMEFLLTPGKVTIVIEAYQQVRHIYTDGRPLPEDPDLKFHGTSIGRWEGDTLIVDTVGFSPLTEITRFVPFSAKARIVERFRLTDPDTMSIETTLTDPEVLTAPSTSTRTLRRHRDWTIAEYICEENNRNFLDANGKAGIRLENPSKK